MLSLSPLSPRSLIFSRNAAAMPCTSAPMADTVLYPEVAPHCIPDPSQKRQLGPGESPAKKVLVEAQTGGFGQTTCRVQSSY